MEKTNILTKQEIMAGLEALPGWEYGNDKISKEFKFFDFMDALAFVNSLAPHCEKLDHHPDIHIFYNKIRFELQRFDVGGKVTDKDLMVAGEIEKLYTQLISK